MKIRLIAVLIIAGFALTFLGGRGLLVSVMPAKEIYNPDVDWTKLHANQRVYACLDFVIEPFEETTEDGRSVSQLYTVPDLKFYDDGVEMAHYMGVLVRSSDYSEWNRLVDNSWAWWDGEYDQLGERGYIEFDGYLRKMNKQERGFLENYLKEWGYSESEIEEAIVPYVMMRNQTPIANIAMFAGGLLMAVAGIILTVVSIIKRK